MMQASWVTWWASWRTSWEDDLDVSGGRQRAAWWAWLLLAAGALALMVAVDHVDTLRQQADESAAQAQRLGRADRQMRLKRALDLKQASAQAASAEKTGAQPPAPPLQGPGVSSVARMARLLAYPWPDHLAMVESQAAATQVVMTDMAVGLDAAGAGAGASAQGPDRLRVRWRLQAAAKDDASALAWASRLPQGELLSREPASEPFTTRAGTYALRVSLEMQP
jgi:hypothetical protein